MKKFIAIADVHLGWKLYSIPELAQDLKDAFARAIDLCIEKGVDYLVIAGDLFDDNHPTPDLVAFVRHQVDKLNAKGIRAIGITGDHDREINGASWKHLCNIEPIESCTEFCGLDYNDKPGYIIDYLKKIPDTTRKLPHWLVLHGQEVNIFPFTEDKKKIDFSGLKMHEILPNLHGVILGDLHSPLKTQLCGLYTRVVAITYCGSLGVVKANEVGSKEGVLYFDGQLLSRLPFELPRPFIKIDLTNGNARIFDAAIYVDKFKNWTGLKPVFKVDYDHESKGMLDRLKPLYHIGFVRPSQNRTSLTGKTEAVNIRSELSSADRTEVVLKQICPTAEIFTLMSSLLSVEQPKSVLDVFKTEKLDT